MKKVKRAWIVEGNDIGEVSEGISNWCERGYVPHGSLAMVNLQGSLHFSQLMVRYEDEEGED